MLTALALRSKAYWGYDEAFMKACVDELTVTAEELERHPAYVVESEGRPLGFYTLGRRSEEECELDYLFVEPEAIGRGLGGRLLHHAVDTARTLGYRRMIIEGDPHAEGFYRARGGELVGAAPSASIPGRELPVFRIDL